jgi:hypothetical protein
MAGKLTGLGATIAVDNSSGTAKTISNDITDFQFATPRGVQDVTGVDKLANERLLLLADYSVTFNMAFNNDADRQHAIFSTVPSTSVARTTSIKPTSGSTPVLACEVLFTDYQVNRSASGELTASAPGVLSDGTVPTWA